MITTEQLDNEYKRIEPGKYVLGITSVEFKYSKNDKPLLEFKFKLLPDKKNEYTPFKQLFFLNEKSLWRLGALQKAINGKLSAFEEENQEELNAIFLGKTLIGKVGYKEYNGKKYVSLEDMSPLNEEQKAVASTYSFATESHLEDDSSVNNEEVPEEEDFPF